MKKRMTAFILLWTLLLPVMVQGTGSSNQGNLKINPGYLKFEAEDLVKEESAAEIAENDNCFEGKGVLLNGAELTITVNTTIAENKIWLRYSAQNSSDHIFFKTDNEEYKKTFLTPTGTEKSFGWFLMKIAAPSENNQIVFTLKTNCNVCVDAIVFSRKSSYFPPDESELFNDIGAIVPQPNYGYPKPSIEINEAHPRVMFTSKDIDRIKNNMSKEQNKSAYDAFRKLADTETDGMLNTSAMSNYNTNILDIIQAKAFDYAIFGNRENGLQAVEAMTNYLDTYSWGDASDRGMASYHYQTHCVFKTSIVYDWCYDLMDDELRKKFVYRCQDMISWCFCGWPLINNVRGAIIGEACANAYLRDMLTFAIATYDEYPDIYNYVGSLILNRYVDVRNYFYQSQAQMQGTEYGPYVLYSDLWCQKLFEAFSGQKIMNDDMYKAAYYFPYLTLPNEDVFKECDEYLTPVGSFNNNAWSNASYLSFIGCVASDALQDNRLKNYFKYVSKNYTLFSSGTGEYTAVEHLIFNNPELDDDSVSYKELPKTGYFPDPKGLMVARTGWEDGIGSSSAAAFMKIAPTYFGYHQNADSGSFQLYYKGDLTGDLGHYARTDTDQYHVYSSNTISHNSLLIYDPNENLVMFNSYDPLTNTGGQRRIGVTANDLPEWQANQDNVLGEVIGQEYGPDKNTPEYSYIAGDIAKAYTDKAQEVKRHMLFMPAKTEKSEAVFFVFDKIKTKQPFRKTFLLQCWEEPEINGNQIVLRRTTDGYDGQLTNYVLYPQNAVIDPIGGVDKQWYVNGRNYVPLASYIPAYQDNPLAYGWGRIEISPAEQQTDDYILNAMYLGDTTETAETEKAYTIENDKVLGAYLLGKAAVFAKGSSRTSEELRFDLPEGQSFDVAAANLAAGEWIISVNGEETGKQVATDEGGMIYFTCTGGSVQLTLTDRTLKTKEFTEEPLPAINTGTALRVNTRKVYTEKNAEVTESGILIPLRSYCEYADIGLEWNGEDESVALNRLGTEFRLYAGQENVVVKDGYMMVPDTVMKKYFGATCVYDANTDSVDVTVNLKLQDSDNPDLIPIIDATWSETSASSGYLSFDGSKDTRWFAQGSGQWITWAFLEESTVESFAIMPNTNKGSLYSFELYASPDGENYEMFYQGQTDGKGHMQTINLEKPVTAKYIKFIGHGNNLTQWNNVSEIEFYDKKQAAEKE